MCLKIDDYYRKCTLMPREANIKRGTRIRKVSGKDVLKPGLFYKSQKKERTFL